MGPQFSKHAESLSIMGVRSEFSADLHGNVKNKNNSEMSSTRADFSSTPLQTGCGWW